MLLKALVTKYISILKSKCKNIHTNPMTLKQKSLLWKHVQTRKGANWLIITTSEGTVKLWTPCLILFNNAHECEKLHTGTESFLKVNKHNLSQSPFQGQHALFRFLGDLLHYLHLYLLNASREKTQQ